MTVIKLFGNDYDLYDLTLPIGEEYPVSWPGHMQFQQKVFNFFENRTEEVQPVFESVGSYQTKFLLMDEHTGTHFDAPAHFVNVERARQIKIPYYYASDVPLNVLAGEAAVIDCSSLIAGSTSGESRYITADYLMQWESNHTSLGDSNVVLFKSGWDREFFVSGHEGRAYSWNSVVLADGPGWPAPDVSAIALLIDRGVKCVGTDGPSMGAAAQGGADIHHLGLESGVLFVEGLAGLDQLPDLGSYFMFFPLPIIRGSGGPGRAIGLVPASPDC